MSSEIDISVIIAVKDRPLELARAIRALLRQTLLPLEIVVVDQTTDDTCEKAARRAFAELSNRSTTLVYRHEPGLSGAAEARDFGFSVAQARLIVFSDDDAELELDGLESFSKIFTENSVVVAAGGVFTNYEPPGLASRIFMRLFYLGPFFDERQPVYWNWKSLPGSSLIPTTKLTGAMMAYRREVFEQVGGFDNRYRGASVGEDVEITQRILALTGRANSVVLSPVVKTIHESIGAWRGKDRTIEFHLISQHYLLQKNLRGNPLNHIRYWWMALGLLVRALVSGARRRTLQPLRSYVAGLKGVWNGYRDCPFLKPSASAGSELL